MVECSQRPAQNEPDRAAGACCMRASEVVGQLAACSEQPGEGGRHGMTHVELGCV